MKLYFYTNKNLMFDFLERSTIAPDSIIKDIKGYRTISTLSDHFLFVTHKKLNRASREKGIAQPEFVYPITLELSAPTEKDGNAIFVTPGETSDEYHAGQLCDYDPETDVGAFLLGEIPFSRVEKIYFDTQDDMDMFLRPSPDYWYPEDKYALLPEDFDDELSLSLDEKQLAAASSIPVEDILSGIHEREKRRAGLLNFVDGTKKWQQEKYAFDIDPSLQNLFSLKDEDIAAALPHYLETKGKGNVEKLILYKDTGNSAELKKADQDKDDRNKQRLYNVIYRAFLQEKVNIKKSPEKMKDICDQVISSWTRKKEAPSVRKFITEIEKLITDATDKNPEEIAAEIPKKVDVLKALMFVAKNPNSYTDFLTSLDVYHADLLTRRRSMVLWGVLNGLYGLPGENFNKENQTLWQFIEEYVLREQKEKITTLSVNAPAPVVTDGSVFELELHEERTITSGEIRQAILSGDPKKFGDAFYEKLFNTAAVEYGSKKKAQNKGYKHSVASENLPAIKKGDVLGSATRKFLEKLIKDCKSPVPNKEKLFKDYIEDEEKFKFVFDQDPKFWKTCYKKIMEQADA